MKENVEYEDGRQVVKVSRMTRSTMAAGAIAGIYREGEEDAVVRAIGVNAVNRAIKAIILANKYLEQDQMKLGCIPDFVDIQIEDITRTAVSIILYRVE